MDRRDFLKAAMFSSLGLGLACTGTPVMARGIPAKSLPGGGPGRCFVLPKSEVKAPLVDLFKIGPGPSSSHTLAPLRIASNFREAVAALPRDTLAKAARFEAHLYGSLSATGRGHRTDRAILAGLLGQKAETCDQKVMDALADDKAVFQTTIGGKGFTVGHNIIVWDAVEHHFPFSNTLVMRLMDTRGKVLFEREYYSTGGGFFAWKGQPPARRGEPKHRFGNMAEFRRLSQDTGKPLHEIMMENEMAILGVGEAEVNRHLDMVIKTMVDGVDLGLTETGLLPAPFEMHRKAKVLFDKAKAMGEADGFMQRISSYAIAVSEGNAAGRLAVTAPTLGSAGTMPALVYVMKNHLKFTQEAMRRGVLAAGLMGLICKTNASVAGAEVGCQGEIGVASAMAAAMMAYASGADLPTTELAATIALEHHLGMSCDPVGGFVIIPCIERNAFGALKAYNAALMARSEIVQQHWEDFDRVVAAMLETGKALPPQFRELGTAGLGVSMVDC
ncbi:MAG TPA: L-serine ammonia-lyase [Syntrophales bacterium]|nr:L-serine ammonia-lyase [Syntrophales bacterium]HPC01798.1 L-serine ammonia-lyase [Syntrophales bacterium]